MTNFTHHFIPKQSERDVPGLVRENPRGLSTAMFEMDQLLRRRAFPPEQHSLSGWVKSGTWHKTTPFSLERCYNPPCMYPFDWPDGLDKLHFSGDCKMTGSNVLVLLREYMYLCEHSPDDNDTLSVLMVSGPRVWEMDWLLENSDVQYPVIILHALNPPSLDNITHMWFTLVNNDYRLWMAKAYGSNGFYDQSGVILAFVLKSLE